MNAATRYPRLWEGHKDPYFPPTSQIPDCMVCEKRSECPSCEKAQRSRRDFTVTSGRCPRLPDRRGFVDSDEKKLYASVFPLVHVEIGDEVEFTYLYLSIPGQKRQKRVYRSKLCDCWYFRDGKDDDGNQIKRRIDFDGHFKSLYELFEYMLDRNWDYCIFRAEITGDCL